MMVKQSVQTPPNTSEKTKVNWLLLRFIWACFLAFFWLQLWTTFEWGGCRTLDDGTKVDDLKPQNTAILRIYVVGRVIGK